MHRHVASPALKSPAGDSGSWEPQTDFSTTSFWDRPLASCSRRRGVCARTMERRVYAVGAAVGDGTCARWAGKGACGGDALGNTSGEIVFRHGLARLVGV